MKNNKSASLFEKEQVLTSLKQSFVKLNPRIMVKNPIMFTVEVCTAIMFLVMIYSIFDNAQGSFVYNAWVFVILFITLLFANFAEAIAEARGKAQADSLRKTREETPAKLLVNGQIKTTSSSQLKKGDVFICEAGDTIPADGEIINGLASIDESAITGESAPVIREAGGDKSSVTGGTKVLSDRIEVLVTQQPGESFLDKMIALVEGASRQKTPNEIALTILLAGFTLVFLIVCVTLKPFADYTGTVITIASFLSLFVCLIPTTIGGLLSAIGIAGMDRALRANVITKSGKAVETAGDIDTLLLDKTGTITIGNRKATHFYPANGLENHAFAEICMMSSLSDETPEGKSIVELARESGLRVHNLNTTGSKLIKFSAETKCSGVDLADGTRIRKGAAEAIRKIAQNASYEIPQDLENRITEISKNGQFNLMFKTFQGVTEDSKSELYLRPETAQGIFVNFANIQRTTRKKLPFGVAQIGKSFRNEITPGNFIFRVREFEQMELEFFCKPDTDLEWFQYWRGYCKNFLLSLGIKEENLRLRDHDPEELCFYSKATTDFEYKFSFGWGELWGVADRTNYDLTQHQEHSGKSLEYFDPETNTKYIPYVIEPSLGVERLFLSIVTEAYDEEVVDAEKNDTRVVMHFHPALAPFKAAVLPLSKKLSEKAQEVYAQLAKHFPVDYDETGSIGKRYRRQDEIGTPFCITVDFETVENDNCVTVRDRDTMEQVRMPIDELVDYLNGKMEF